VNEVEVFAKTLANIENRLQSPSLLMKSNVTVKNALNVVPLKNNVHSLTKSGFAEMDIEERSCPSLLKPNVISMNPQCVNTNRKLETEPPSSLTMCMEIVKSPKPNEMESELVQMDIEETPNSTCLLNPYAVNVLSQCVNTNSKLTIEASCSSIQ